VEEIREPKDLPSVEELVKHLEPLQFPRPLLVEAARSSIQEMRNQILKRLHAPEAPSNSEGEISFLRLVERAKQFIDIWTRSWPVKVINATGVLLHTNLGRAPLSKAAVEAMVNAAGYCDLEMDIESGERGHRDKHVADLLVRLTGAEAATIVNNNAGALFLTLSALAAGREVIVSRSQSVEIGGRFRIPDVMAQSGAFLKEVGTTNRTYASDYQNAISESTAALLVVHRSNFRLIGFVHDPSLSEIVEIGRLYNLPVIHDLGSGALVDSSMFGLEHEPMVQESVSAGVALTLFSGDKLLGGPQAGMIVGRGEYVSRIRSHPLFRALRCDKVTLAAMHATLMHYLRGEEQQSVPVLWMLGRKQVDLYSTVQSWKSSLLDCGDGFEVKESVSKVGGGSIPEIPIASVALVIDPSRWNLSADELAYKLRTGDPAVVGVVEDDKIWLDARTVMPEEGPLLVQAVRRSLLLRD